MTDPHKVSQFSIHEEDRLAQEASSWVAQIDAGRLTQADRASLREWASRSPRHRAELEATARVWMDIDSMVIAAAIRPGDGTPSWPKLALSWCARHPAGAVMTALTVLLPVLLAGLLIIGQSDTGHQSYKALFAVPAGQNEVVTLPDGSSLHLNTDSVAEVRYTQTGRHIDLLRGEAFFDVAKDKMRPFRVNAAGHTAQALGTAFVIRVSGGGASITVTEGEVAILEAQDCSLLFGCSANASRNKAVVSAGEMAAMQEPSPAINTVSEQEIQQQLAWRDGILVFSGDTLADVVEEVSRYTSAKIIISQPALRDLRIGGVFRTGEVDALLSVLETGFGVSVERLENGVIYLSQADAP